MEQPSLYQAILSAHNRHRPLSPASLANINDVVAEMQVQLTRWKLPNTQSQLSSQSQTFLHRYSLALDWTLTQFLISEYL